MKRLKGEEEKKRVNRLINYLMKPDCGCFCAKNITFFLKKIFLTSCEQGQITKTFTWPMYFYYLLKDHLGWGCFWEGNLCNRVVTQMELSLSIPAKWYLNIFIHLNHSKLQTTTLATQMGKCLNMCFRISVTGQP